MKVLTGKLSEFYHKEFTEAAKELGIELIIVDPMKLNFIFGSPSLIFDNEGNEIKADAFFVRATNTHYKQYTYLAQALNSQGCIMLDSMDRFTGYAPTKEMSSIRRAIQGHGAKTYYFNPEFQHSNNQIIRDLYPIFIKPVNGKNNIALGLTSDLSNYNIESWILQENLSIVNEYRVLAYRHSIYEQDIFEITNKKTIGLKGKNPKALKKVNREKIKKITDFLTINTKIKGLFGYDVAELKDGSFKLIEANYSPRWERTQRLKKHNIAMEILLILKSNYDETCEYRSNKV